MGWQVQNIAYLIIPFLTLFSTEYNFESYSIFAAVLSCVSFFLLKNEYPLSFSLFVSYVLGVTTMMPVIPIATPHQQVMLWFLSFKSALFFFLLLIIVGQTVSRRRLYLLGFLGLINAVITILSACTHRGALGIFTNTSFNAAFTAMLLPYIYVISGWAWCGVSFLSIWLGTGASGMVIATVVTVAYIFQKVKVPSRRYIITAIALCWAAVPLWYLVARGEFHETSRWQIYKAAYDYFRAHLPMATGGGLGSWFVLGMPMAMRDLRVDHNAGLWTYLHSDVLTIGFELGAIGLGLALWSYFDAVRLSYQRRSSLCSSLLGAGIFAMFYYPLQVPATAFVIVSMAAAALRRHDEVE